MARLFVRRGMLRLLVLFVWLSAGIAPAAEFAAASADEAVASGKELEQQRHWKDAIDWYERSLEQWPENEHLTYGLRRAKFQFSIERRYDDESFQSGLVTLSRHEALDVLDHVLSKVQANFVEPISTQSLVAHGTESLWLALANQKFLDKNLFGADAARIQEMRGVLRQQYWNKPVSDRQQARRVVGEICDMGQRLLDLDAGAVVMEYVFGACNCLDDYSNVLTPTRYADLFSNIDGQFVGIGIVMEGKLGRGMELVDVLPDSPALESGLHPGEWIVTVDGVDCRFLSTEEAAHLLTGLSGSRVELEVSGADDERRSVTCIRREVVVKSIPVATMLDSQNGIAYIRLTAFQKNTTEELDQALRALKQQGMRSLIWDVRGNPGGLLKEAVSVLDRFIDDGVLVSTKGRTRDQDEAFYAFGPGTWDIPLVLLIDENSASASEIVAGCIHDHHRGTIVGRKSYGKWSVQSIYPTTNGMGLRLTTARFYSPDGHTYSKIGIEPDVPVELDGDDPPRRSSAAMVDPAGDPDVRAAIKVLTEPAYTQR
jgi:carboxyl-terminal processing protease